MPHDVTVVELSGRMSLGNQLQLVEDRIKKLVEAGARKVILDVTAVAYIDSAAIGVMVMLYGMVAKGGGKLRMCGPSPVVAKIFEITQLKKIIPIDADLAASAAAL